MEILIKELYKTVVLNLKALYPDSEARAIADRLFEHYIKLTPTQRVISGNLHADNFKMQVITDAVTKLLNNVPLQYVIGIAQFRDLEFDVNPAVLIPRPETEELVSLIVKNIDNKADHMLRILDIGAGSGCIAISLKHFIPGSKVYAVDISKEAIKVATTNANKNGTEINFIHADILEQSQWDLIPECEMIVSNPPYVTNAEKRLMRPNVLDYEPHTALFVPDEDPLLFYRAILDLAKIKLSNNGFLWFEINEMFGSELRDMALSQGFMDVIIISDIHKKERFLQARI